MDKIYNKRLVEKALCEDMGPNDPVSMSLAGYSAEGRIRGREQMIFCGGSLVKMVFECLGDSVSVDLHILDGETLKRGDDIATIKGPAGQILSGERVALNFIQRLSGIATLTGRFVEEVAGTGVLVCDTRKTTPGLRHLEKYAVKCGGGVNHRFSLTDGVLIKDNAIKIFGSVTRAVEEVKRRMHHLLKVEVEVGNLDELEEALSCGVDAILLDNMPVDMVREAVSLTGKKITLEASGNITLENARDYAQTGVDIISSGMLTHSPPSVDISLDLL